MKIRRALWTFCGSLAAAALLMCAIPANPAAAEQIARPSNPGGPGAAATLTGNAKAGAKIFADKCMACHGAEGKGGVPNPGSTDGTVPPLNPIDSTMVSKNYKVFAYNIDLFLQNGSVPDGPHPAISMPPWGADKMLTQQQLADVIAYVISLNPAK
ncbi:MAG TPA: cytochrome c [Desulfuromonadales bacterium]|nr:cytochrome c [Desulfuromonadales bacterium]